MMLPGLSDTHDTQSCPGLALCLNILGTLLSHLRVCVFVMGFWWTAAGPEMEKPPCVPSPSGIPLCDWMVPCGKDQGNRLRGVQTSGADSNVFKIV